MLILMIIAASVVSAANITSNFVSCVNGLNNLATVTSGSSDYSNVTTAFNLRINYQPDVVVYPSTVEDVQQIVSCGAQQGMNVSARSGGHSYAAYGLSGNLVIDLRNLTTLTVDSNGTAVVGTGNDLGDLALGLWNNGQRALPHGTCPYVGTGGHPLFGGFGLYSRQAGLLLDNIISAEVVLANGSLVTASNTSNSDLFWALRGAGASFGIVTSWTFATFPAPTSNVIFNYMTPALTSSQLISLFNAVQSLAITLPNNAALIVEVAPDPQGSGKIAAQFYGAYYGDESGFNSTFGSLVSQFPEGTSANVTSMNWIEGLVTMDGSLSTSVPDIHDTFFAKSLMTNTTYSNDSVTSWVNFIFEQGANTTLQWFAEVDVWGGAIKSAPSQFSSFAHRDALLSFQLYASSPNFEPPYPSSGIQFITDMSNALDPNPQAAYPNYVDPTLTAQQWSSLYYGDNYDRLTQVKATYDPKNVFNFQQAIPPASSGSSSSGGGSSGGGSSGTGDSGSSGSNAPAQLSFAWITISTLFTIAYYTL